jgi:hypothetical protein
MVNSVPRSVGAHTCSEAFPAERSLWLIRKSQLPNRLLSERRYVLSRPRPLPNRQVAARPLQANPRVPALDKERTNHGLRSQQLRKLARSLLRSAGLQPGERRGLRAGEPHGPRAGEPYGRQALLVRGQAAAAVGNHPAGDRRIEAKTNGISRSVVVGSITRELIGPDFGVGFRPGGR